MCPRQRASAGRLLLHTGRAALLELVPKARASAREKPAAALRGDHAPLVAKTNRPGRMSPPSTSRLTATWSTQDMIHSGLQQAKPVGMREQACCATSSTWSCGSRRQQT